MTELFFMAALVGYLAAAAVRIVGTPKPAVSRAADVALWGGLALHLVGIALIVVEVGALPVHTPAASIAFLGSVVALGAGLIRAMPRTEVLSGVLVSLASVMVGISMLLPADSHSEATALASVWFPIHALAVFVGLASFACAFGVSCVFLVVRQRLKRKNFSSLGRMPSLEGLDQLNTRFVVAGFLSLTLGIAAGGAWAASMGGGGGLGPTVTVTLVLWAWYALAVLVRVVGRWRGRLAAVFSVGGFVGMVVSLGAVMTLLSGWH